MLRAIRTLVRKLLRVNVNCTPEAAVQAAKERCEAEGRKFHEPFVIREHVRCYRIWSPANVLGATIIDVAVDTGEVVAFYHGLPR